MIPSIARIFNVLVSAVVALSALINLANAIQTYTPAIGEARIAPYEPRVGRPRPLTAEPAYSWKGQAAQMRHRHA